VVQVSMIQFGIQMLGFGIAAHADELGAATMLLMQFLILQVGVFAFIKLKLPHTRPNVTDGHLLQQIGASISEGFRTVRGSPYLRAVVILNFAMGVFFMGSYIVTIPLLIRDAYQGSSVELSWVNGANSMGLVLTILFLMRLGDIHRQGRALLLAQGIGAVVLAGGGLGLGFYSLIFFVFLWGLCGGFAMTMSRTIMQEMAPANQRARIMAFYSFSFMGAGPIGALLSGYLVTWVGPLKALMMSSVAMLVVTCILSLRSTLWSLDTRLTAQP
jgi:MFS family permease